MHTMFHYHTLTRLSPPEPLLTPYGKPKPAGSVAVGGLLPYNVFFIFNYIFIYHFYFIISRRRNNILYLFFS